MNVDSKICDADSNIVIIIIIVAGSLVVIAIIGVLVMKVCRKKSKTQK